MNRTNVISVIPARGGSKGLPGKNLLPVAGKPLLVYSIEASLACPVIDRTIVSTDAEEIQAAAITAGAEAPFLRPPTLATDSATTEGVLQHAVEWLEQHDSYRADILVFLQPTDLFRKQRWLADVVEALLQDPNLDSAFVGTSTYKNYWKMDGDRFVPISHRGYGPRQSKSRVFREDTGLACATRADIIRSGRRIGERVKIVETDDFCTSIDIHTDFDRWLAERIIADWGRRPNE